MQRRLLVILLIAVIALPCAAQKISIGQFKRVKFDLATQKLLPVDKKMAHVQGRRKDTNSGAGG